MRTIQFLVSLVGRIAVTGPNGQPPSNADELIEKHVDEVLDELLRLNAVDPAIDLDLTQNEVVISVLVEEPNPLFATITASGLIRSAIHAAQGSTPDWPGPFDAAWYVQLLSLSTEPVNVAFSDSTTAELGECDESGQEEVSTEVLVDA